ncbi:MAG: FecR family protein [Chitinophagaceae bacterium]
MDRQTFLDILSRYRSGAASPQEIAFLHAYYLLHEPAGNGLEGLTYEEKLQLKQDIRDGIRKEIDVWEPAPVRRMNRARWLVAASLVLLAGLGSYFFFMRQEQDREEEMARVQVEPIVPGGNKATLTLADGSTVLLDDAGNGVLATQGNAIVKKNADGEVAYDLNAHPATGAATVYNTINTPRGGQYKLTLPDGTKVWLNAATLLRFPTTFTGVERKVELEGEAYFEVAANKKMPFRVQSAAQTIEVLGTHFNINTYKEEADVRTTLLEGSVKVVSPLTPEGKVLVPGQQSLLVPGKAGISVAEVNVEEVVAWKNGLFIFNKASLETIMHQVARWYDVEVEYRGRVTEDVFVGKLNRSENVQEVLRILELNKVKFHIEGRKIIVGE